MMQYSAYIIITIVIVVLWKLFHLQHSMKAQIKLLPIVYYIIILPTETTALIAYAPYKGNGGILAVKLFWGI